MPLGANKAAIMGVAGTAAAGDVVLLSSQTASSDSAIAFTSGLDSTYGEYIIRYYVVGPEVDVGLLQFNASIDGGSNYNVTKDTTHFRATHNEDGSSSGLTYETGLDRGHVTSYQQLANSVGNGSDECVVGEFHLFNPASTEFYKHFYGVSQCYRRDDFSAQSFIGGFLFTTSAVNALNFNVTTGDFDGIFKMWGVKF